MTARFRRLAVWIPLGLASGLPLKLIGDTLQTWMKRENVDYTTIGLFALVGLPYNLKFLWAPIMDRLAPSFPGFRGRRKGWLLLTQLALVLALVALANLQPARNLSLVAALALVVAFFSASQDVVSDAFRAESLESAELGLGNALHIGSYRIAMLISGAGALILVGQHVPWRTVYLLMAALMAMGVLGTWLSPPSLHDSPPPKNLQEAVVEPFREFMGRRGAWEVLTFAVLYKLGDMLAQALPTLFYLDVGFTLTQIGTVTKFVGTGAIIVGMAAGGALMLHMKLKRALLVFGILQGISSLAYLWLAHSGPRLSLLALTVSLENLCYGLGLAAFTSFLMGQCHLKYTATQFALLSSLTALTRTVLAAPAGSLVKHWGWSNYFLFCTVIAVPGLLMLMRFDHWAKPETEGAAAG